MTGAGAKALAWLGNSFVALRDDILAAIGGTGYALAAGAIGRAVAEDRPKPNPKPPG